MEQDRFKEFMDIVRVLRSKDGCPWDREQTHDSLRYNMVEESYEAVEAINNNDMTNLCEELGDTLLLVCMQAVIAEENGEFTMEDVIRGIADKMIKRHPHVFKERDTELTASGVLENWETIKQEEKHEKQASEGMLRVAKALPANIRAEKVQKKASKAGMDFETVDEVKGKVEEEWNELLEACEKQNSNMISEEFGDLMFSIINLSRFLQINAENSLTNATNKFINRFVSVERLAKSVNKSISQMSAGELDALWRQAKE